jgi:hypothetical protein
MVCPGALSIGDDGAFLCIPMQIGVKFEHWRASNGTRLNLSLDMRRPVVWFYHMLIPVVWW